MELMQTVGCPVKRPAKARVDLDEPLSVRLRETTRELHQAVEAKLDLLCNITGRADYVACLRRFHGLYRPLERQLRIFPDWRDHGLEPIGPDCARFIASDLAVLQPGTPLPPDAPNAARPNLCSFAHALGARYVLEGSALGGEVILRHLVRSGVDGAATAHAFLGVSRRRPGAWRSFRAALDLYGTEQPEAVPHVLTGAERSFRAVGEWLHVSRWKAP